MRADLSFVRLLLVLAAGIAGCGSPPSPTDGGSDAPLPPDAPARDAGDPMPPTVLSTEPDDDASGVPTGRPIRVVFSEPMDTAVGALDVEAGGAAIPVDLAWSEDLTEVTATPTAGTLPSGATIDVTVPTSFRDASGTPLAAAVVFSFETLDEDAPAVVSTSPAEGATGVDSALAVITLTFDEPMRTTTGSVALTGGAGTVGAPSWSGETLTVPVSGLAADTTYRLALTGFVDVTGNALDGTPVLGDGVLDFTTGADTHAPVVVDSSPMEGQLDVSVDRTTRITIDFSEPMAATGTATLVVASISTELAGSWSRSGTRFSASVTGLLALEATHRLVLAGFEDVAGNALDGTVVLGDGALDFTTGVDTQPPHVAFTTPSEGATGVAAGTSSLVVVFSETMDTTRDTIVLDDGDGRTVTRSGVWSSAGTVLTVPLGDALWAGDTYVVDLRAFTDATGTALDPAHAYLGDGVLTFATATPTGEACPDALTIAEASSTTAAGHEWSLESGRFTSRDGEISCDTAGSSNDGLVRVRKRTPSASDGGTFLHVRAESTASSDDVDVEIYAGLCDPSSPLAASARQTCLWDGSDVWETWLDVGAGDYFVWVANDGTGTFDGVRLVIEEVAVEPPGESCASPLSTSSPAPLYTPPASAGAPHVWTIPAAAVSALDRTTSHTGEPSYACMASTGPSRLLGRDAVIELVKTADDSRLIVDVDVPTGSSTSDVHVELLRGACGDASATSAACAASLEGTQRFDVSGPAGPMTLWLGAHRDGTATTGDGTAFGDFPGATVRVREITPGPGDTCATAIPITPGAAIPVTADRPYDLDLPACSMTPAVTWYSYTTSQRLGIVRSNVGAALSVGTLADPRARCTADTASQPLAVLAPIGTRVCIAVESGVSGLTSLSIDEQPYDGPIGDLRDLGVTRPSTVSSVDILNFTTLVGGEVVATRTATPHVLSFPHAGGVELTALPIAPTTANGSDGIGVGGSLYTVGPTTSATMPRLFRVVRGATSWDATPIDTGTVLGGPSPSYLADDVQSLTYDGSSFLFATCRTILSGAPAAGLPTSFYSVPLAGGDATYLGSNETIARVAALAVDATYLYVEGWVAGTEMVVRLRRDALSDPLALPEPVFTAAANLSDEDGSIILDPASPPRWMLVRDYGYTAIWLVWDPAGPAPITLGTLFPGDSPTENGNSTMAWDPVTHQLFFAEDVTTTGGIWRVME